LKTRQQTEVQLMVHLGIIRQLMATREAKLFENMPLNPSQFGVLNHFSHAPKRSWTVTELATVMEMNQPGITKIVSVLLTKKLLESISDSDDKRRRHLKITVLGIKLCDEVLSSLLPDISYIFGNKDDDEILQMQAHIEQLMHWLDEHRDDIKQG